MKEKLLFAWKHKYERIQWELKDNETKLEKVIKRQKQLVDDIVIQIIFLFICIFVIFLLWICRSSVVGWTYGYAFYAVYILAVWGIIIAAAIYNVYQLVKRIKRCLFHAKKRDFLYSRPVTVDSNYPLHIPPNYYAERKCIEWLLNQYMEETIELFALKQKIEHTTEQELDAFWEELENIVIYERIGCAKG